MEGNAIARSQGADVLFAATQNAIRLIADRIA